MILQRLRQFIHMCCIFFTTPIFRLSLLRDCCSTRKIIVAIVSRPGLSCSTLGLLYLCQKESWHHFDCKNRSQSHLSTHANRLETSKYGALLWPGFLHLGRPCPGLPITNKLRGLYNDPVPFKRAPFHGFGAQPRSRSERGTRSYYSLYLQIVQSVLIYI